MSACVDALLHALESCGAKKSGAGWSARCPAHDDKRASLSINEAANGDALVHCHAGCNVEAVVAALGLTISALFAKNQHQEPSSAKGNASPEATYDYCDEKGNLVYQVVRFPNKEFRQRRPDGNGKWIWDLKGIQRLPYRLQEILGSDKEQTVYVPEGEKDVETLRAHGFVATTNSGGAGKWRPEFAEPFRGRHVVILPDNDSPGEDHAKLVARSLQGIAASARILKLPDQPAKGDVTDWLNAGHKVEELAALLEKTPIWKPEDSSKVGTPAVARKRAFPRMADEAFHGLAGRIVRLIEPHSEADPVGILLQLLTGVGNCFGRGAFFEVEASKHPSNLFVVCVGESSKARKGTSWGHVRKMLALADPDWAASCIVNGLSSGEGLIYAIRDPHSRFNKKGEMEIDDPGVEDKRLLVVETEFATVLRIAQRDGNTLTGIMRAAWDGADLRTLTKTSPCRATGPHISVVGHITSDDLLRYLDSTDMANGFANRVLWVAVKRSKELPNGGNLQESALAPLVEELREVVGYARQEWPAPIPRDAEADSIWRTVYHDLSEGRPGIVGAILGRAEAQVVRLSLLYALLDRSPSIRAVHMQAALAVMDYVDESARVIFGDEIGNPIADEILKLLRQEGAMTRQDIRREFSGHVRGLQRALDVLKRYGLADSFMKPTDGRPAECWFALPEAGAESAESVGSSGTNASNASDASKTAGGT